MEDRIKKLELTVNRLSRRSRKVASAMITPYPISNAVFGDNVSGPVLRYMFPCAGKITKGLVVIGKKLKDGMLVEIKLKDDIHEESKSYIMARKNILTNPNMNVDSGDQLTVSIKPVNPEEIINEVWVSFLWTPTVKEVDIKSFLIDELENASKEVLPCPATPSEEGNID